MAQLEDNARVDVVKKYFTMLGFSEEIAIKLTLIYKKYRAGGYSEPQEPATFSV